MQRLWEFKIDWDDPLATDVHTAWSQWRFELKCLSSKHIPRYYFPDGADVVAIELNGFSDVSEDAYAAIYLRLTDSTRQVHTSMVMQGCSDQTLNDSMSVTMRSSPSLLTLASHPTSLQYPIELHLRLDQQHHCPKLAGGNTLTC